MPRKGQILVPISVRLERHSIPEAITGCTICWTSWNNKGYARFNVCNTVIYAHRAAWELANGRALLDDELVCHRCDNPPCVNADHLFLGTHKTNRTDRESKGRGNQPSGDGNGKVKFSDAVVKAALAEYDALPVGNRRGRVAPIAERYGMSVPYLSAVGCRRRRQKYAGSPVFHR